MPSRLGTRSLLLGAAFFLPGGCDQITEVGRKSELADMPTQACMIMAQDAAGKLKVAVDQPPSLGVSLSRHSQADDKVVGFYLLPEGLRPIRVEISNNGNGAILNQRFDDFGEHHSAEVAHRELEVMQLFEVLLTLACQTRVVGSPVEDCMAGGDC